MKKNSVLFSLFVVLMLAVAGCASGQEEQVTSEVSLEEVESSEEPVTSDEDVQVESSEEEVNAENVLFTDAENGVRFVTDAKCMDYFKVSQEGAGVDARYSVTLPNAKTWNDGVIVYEVMTQEEVDGYNDDEVPGKPQVDFEVAGGLRLIHWNPNDVPLESDLPSDCGVVPEKL